MALALDVGFSGVRGRQDGAVGPLELGQVPAQALAAAHDAPAQRPRHHRRARTIPLAVPGGQPGRPVSAARLTRRLEDLGIRPGQARSTALFQLAAEVPAAILARTLGISTDVAVTWQRISSGDWTAYAAAVSRRAPRKPVSSRHETPSQA